MEDSKLSARIFIINVNTDNSTKYFQIKKQTVTLGLEDHCILQIIDISDHIMYNITNAEKKLLSTINATVSHEMRNPLNSIYS